MSSEASLSPSTGARASSSDGDIMHEGQGACLREPGAHHSSRRHPGRGALPPSWASTGGVFCSPVCILCFIHFLLRHYALLFIM